MQAGNHKKQVTGGHLVETCVARVEGPWHPGVFCEKLPPGILQASTRAFTGPVQPFSFFGPPKRCAVQRCILHSELWVAYIGTSFGKGSAGIAWVRHGCTQVYRSA